MSGSKPFNLSSLLAGCYDNIYIFTHVRPDGDAIGSSLAHGNALKTEHKNVEVFCGCNTVQVFFSSRGGNFPGLFHS